MNNEMKILKMKKFGDFKMNMQNEFINKDKTNIIQNMNISEPENTNNKLYKIKKFSDTGSRTPIPWMKTTYPNR